MTNFLYKVVLIEDDPMVQEVNRQFIERVKGFKVIGTASNGEEGIEMIQKYQPDIAMIDIYMPNQDGLETLKQIRSEGHPVDVIAITAATDMETVRRVLQNGAMDYIVKPFKFERIQKALENYHSFRSQLENKESISQKELDEIFFENEVETNESLPKGLNEVTLNKITKYLSEQSEPISAEEVAEGIGIARVTARRYLEYLEKTKKVQIKIKYGGVGRPVNRYIISK